jgi:threonine-phosphate decarboxylase
MLHGHGGDIYSLAGKIGVELSELADFSSNISPLPLPREFIEFLASSLGQISMLPEVDSLGLRRALASRFGLFPENFIACAGTTEWIYRIARVTPAEQAVIPVPAYSDYMDAALMAGLNVVESGPWPDGRPGTDVRVLADICSRIDRPTIVYLCNPNNPTGRFITPLAIVEAAKDAPGALWVIDESYAPFIADDNESSVISNDMPPNILVLRSFSKIYRIPGLRLGYVAGSRKTIADLATHLLPWATGRLAQLAGEYLLKMEDYEERVRSFWQGEKEKFLRATDAVAWLEYLPGQTHFMLFRVLPPWSAEKVVSTLSNSGILVRNCANFRGLEGEHIRIALRTPEDNMRLVARLESF